MIRVLRNVFSKQFRKYSRFTLVENTIGNFPKVPRATFLESDKLFCFISICKFGSFKNPFAMIISQSELYLKICSVSPNKKRDFYKIWQQCKELKTMETRSEASPDNFNDGCIHRFQPEPTHKIH